MSQVLIKATLVLSGTSTHRAILTLVEPAVYLIVACLPPLRKLLAQISAEFGIANAASSLRSLYDSTTRPARNVVSRVTGSTVRRSNGGVSTFGQPSTQGHRPRDGFVEIRDDVIADIERAEHSDRSVALMQMPPQRPYAAYATAQQ